MDAFSLGGGRTASSNLRLSKGGINDTLDDQQEQTSPRFHQWSAPGEFGKQSGPAGLFAAP